MQIPDSFLKQGVIGSPESLEDEKVLLEYERGFQALANFSPQLMWMAHADGWIYWYNRLWYQYTGTKHDEMEGWGWQSVHHPDELPKVMAYWRSSIDTGKPFELTFPLRGANGNYRTFLTRVVPIRDPGGNVLRWIGTNTDVSEQIETEKSLQRSEKQLNDFFDTATIGLHWVGPDGTILRANQAELDLLGYSAEEYIGQNIADFHVDAPIIENILMRLCANEKLVNYEARLRCKDGSIKHVLINSSVYWEDGQFIHTRCFTRDITDIKATDFALRESEERFRTMAEGTETLIATCDEASNNTYFNKSWTVLTGRTMEELLNFGWADLVHPDDRAAYLGLYLSAFDKREPFQGEFRIVNHKGVYRWLISNGSPRFRPDRTFAGYISSCVDITNRKLAEESLKHRLKREQLTRRVAELSNQGLELSKILQILAQEIGDFFEADRSFILHFERTNDKYDIRTHAQYCRSDDVRPYNASGMPPNLQAFYSNNKSLESLTGIIRVNTPEEYAKYFQESLENYPLSKIDKESLLKEMLSFNIESEKMRALLRLPVTYRGIAYGNIVLHQCLSDRIWTDEELATIQEIATQVGTVFYQAEIMQEEKRSKEALQKGFEREQLLRKVVEVIGQSFDIDLILKTVVEEVGAYLQVDRASISRYYLENEILIVDASAQYIRDGVMPIDNEDLNLLIKSMQHLRPEALRAGDIQVLNVSDQESYISYLRERMKQLVLPGVSTERLIEMILKYEVKASLRVNIDYRGTPYGSISVSQTTHNREWQPEEVELVKIIAEHAGSALYQAELYRQAQGTAVKEQNARIELERYAKRLEASNNELEQFATIASHDLQEPLRKIQLFSGILEEIVPNEGQEYLTRMASAASRMRGLVEGLLTLSRINRKGESFEPIDLNIVVKNVIEDLQVSIQESSAKVTIEKLGGIEGDENQIRQIIQNLLSNAIKYRRDDVTPVIRVSGRQNGEYYETTVEDNGIGTNQEYFEKVFEPFQRLHSREKYTGTGMGLAIVKKIVDRHNGSLVIESEPDKGSKFSFSIPVKQR